MKPKISIIVLAIGLSFNIACQQEKSGEQQALTPFDRSGLLPGPMPTPIPDEPLLECNGFQVGSNGFAGKVKTFYSTSGAYDPNRVRIKLSSLPNNFSSTTDKPYFDFYRWKVSQSGSDVYIDPTPMSWDLIYTKTGATVGSFGTNKFDITEFNRIQNDSTTSANLSDYEIQLKGTAQDYQVVRVAIKKSVGSASDQVLAESDFLIPAFVANPKSYSTTHAALLGQIHPHYTRINQSWPSSEFKSIGDSQFCF